MRIKLEIDICIKLNPDLSLQLDDLIEAIREARHDAIDRHKILQATHDLKTHTNILRLALKKAEGEANVS